MSRSSTPDLPLDSFQSFGDLLKYLRKRARLTQRELSIMVKYSEAQISRLEQNQRSPDLSSLAALFIPALYIEDEPETIARLMELAGQARGETLADRGTITFSGSTRQETVEKIETEFPATNLPLLLNSFIGRERELHEIETMLGRNQTRLVTLIGIGGCGKTRLGIEVTRQRMQAYRDGVWLVELAPISNPAHISQTWIASLGLVSRSEDSPTQTLIKFLRTRHTLLIVDNCEHLLPEAAQIIEEILRACPQVQVLATSREILNIPGEIRFQVPSLSLSTRPDSPEAEINSQPEAVQLFVERAEAAFPAFRLDRENLHAVLQICHQLDGMPLAIELAAARASMLSVKEIAARLERNTQLLTGGSERLPHHRTLDATIQWSYDLLSEQERLVFNRLAVFAGGWTLEAAEMVVSDSSFISSESVLDVVGQLVNKSLVVVDWQRQGDTRYTMLQTIHRFSEEKLRASGEVETRRARHFEYFFRMAEQGEEHLFTSKSSIDWAETEIDNLRAALAWSLERGAGRGLELMLHVWPLWLLRGYSSEGNEWLDRLLSVHVEPSPARARALLLAGDLAGFRGDSARQARLIQESLTLARQLGDTKRIAWALMEMGLVVRDAQPAEAIAFLTESLSLFEELKETLWMCRTSFLLAETYTKNGDLQAAGPLWEQGLDLSRQMNDKWHIAWGLEGLGHVERLRGNFGKAGQFYKESLNLKVSVMDKTGIAYSLEAFAQLAGAQGQLERAATLGGAAERLGQTLNLLLIPSREKLYATLPSNIIVQSDEESFGAAWNRGWSMQMQEAIEYALSGPPV